MASSATATVVEPTVVSRPPAGAFIVREKRSTILCLLLALLILAFYNPIVHNGFTNLDDNAYITDNVHVRAGLTWVTVKWAFRSFEGANWHPLSWLSHALDIQLFGLNPVGHHYVSVLLHAANAILLFLLLEWATGFTWGSFIVAALFALHPLNVESVAWASERKNVLSMLFFLLTLHAYSWYARRLSVRRYLVVAGLFAVGLLAKPEIITLPCVLLLWDYWPLRRMFGSVAGSQFSVLSESRTDPAGNTANNLTNAVVPRSFGFLVLEKVPLLLLSAASAVITMRAQVESYAVRDATNRVRFGNAAVAYVRYLGKAFWPTRLAALYPHQGRLLTNWEILGSAALLIAITAFVLGLGKSHRYLPMGWFWFLGTLVPVIGIVQVGVQAMADRYAYIPYIGLFICLVWGTAELARDRRIAAVWLAVPAVVVLAALGIVSSRQIRYWHDSESLWRHTLSVTDQNFFAHNALAYALGQQGRVEEAIAEFNASTALHAYTPSALNSIGVYEQTHGHVQEAIAQYTRSLDASTDAKSRADALGHLSSAFMQTGDFVRSKKSCGYALRENPDDSTALVDSGLLAEREGDFSLAASQISHAMKVQPADVGYLLLAQALRRTGRVAEANDALATAQRLSPDIAQARQQAAQVLATAGIETD